MRGKEGRIEDEKREETKKAEKFLMNYLHLFIDFFNFFFLYDLLPRLLIICLFH